jgi:hypothetical protein
MYNDFRIFKNSKFRLRENIEYFGDKEYQGIQKVHAKSRTFLVRLIKRARSQLKTNTVQLAIKTLICLG